MKEGNTRRKNGQSPGIMELPNTNFKNIMFTMCKNNETQDSELSQRTRILKEEKNEKLKKYSN